MSESLRQAQNRNPDLAPVHRAAGLPRFNAGATAQAEKEYLRAIEIDPADSDAYRRLGQVYLRNGPSIKALKAFQRAVEIAPKDFKTYQDLGTFYRSQGDEKQAALLFEKCVELAPDEPATHFALGSAYSDLGRFPEAEGELRKSIALEETPPALNNLGLVLMNQSRDLDAIPLLLRASVEIRQPYLTLMNLGTAYRRTNQLQKSRRAYEQSLALAEKEMIRDPADGLVRSGVAYLSARLGNRDRAQLDIAQALSLASDVADVRDMAVWVYEALDKRNDAIEILKKSPDVVLLEVFRWPDLADLHKDSRFKELLDLHGISRQGE
jgi:Flp pilus assembly protein TadD